MSESRRDQLVLAARQAQQKFDYFVAGLAAAATAYIVQNLELAELSRSRAVFEVLGTGALILGLWSSLQRIRYTNRMAASNIDVAYIERIPADKQDEVKSKFKKDLERCELWEGARDVFLILAVALLFVARISQEAGRLLP